MGCVDGQSPPKGGGGEGGGQTASSSSSSPSSSSTSNSSASSSSSGAGGSGGAALSCKDFPLCDDFEGVAAGGPPDAARWQIVSPNCSGTGTISIDDTQARSGTKSLRVDGKGGYCNHVFAVHSAAVVTLGKTFYGRFYMRPDTAQGNGHTTFMNMKDSIEMKDLRMGGQNQILMWNRESDDATLPSLSPTGVGLSTALPAKAWSCIEFQVDGAAGTIQTWVNSQEIAGLVVDGTPTPDVDQAWINQKPGWKPNLTDFKLGWEDYAGQNMTIWFDDVALASTRIGCQ